MRWAGNIGYIITQPKEEGSDVYVKKVTLVPYRGQLMSRSSTWSNGTGTNDNIMVNTTKISVIADAFAYANYQHIRFVEYMNALYEITSIDATQRPRLILTLGGVYNGPKS